MHLFIYAFMYSFIYTFIHECIYLFLYLFIHLFIYSFIYTFIYAFIYLFILKSGLVHHSEESVHNKPWIRRNLRRDSCQHTQLWHNVSDSVIVWTCNVSVRTGFWDRIKNKQRKNTLLQVKLLHLSKKTSYQ